MKKLYPLFAVAFSGFIVYLFDKIWGQSINWEKIRTVKLGKLLTGKISVYQLLIFFVILFLVLLIAKKLSNENKRYYTRKQRKLRKFNKTIIQEAHILVRWEVFFDYGKPFISDLTLFCMKHEGPSIRFIQNKCPVTDCQNNHNTFNENAVRNLIESDLIDKWEKIK